LTKQSTKQTKQQNKHLTKERETNYETQNNQSKESHNGISLGRHRPNLIPIGCHGLWVYVSRPRSNHQPTTQRKLTLNRYEWNLFRASVGFAEMAEIQRRASPQGYQVGGTVISRNPFGGFCGWLPQTDETAKNQNERKRHNDDNSRTKKEE